MPVVMMPDVMVTANPVNIGSVLLPNSNVVHLTPALLSALISCMIKNKNRLEALFTTTAKITVCIQYSAECWQ